MTQAVAIANLAPDPEPIPAVEPEPRPIRLAIPLLLAAGWGALIACSGTFLFDEAKVDRAAATDRAAFVEPATAVAFGEPARVPASAVPAAIPVATERANTVSESRKATPTVQTVSVATPAEALRPAAPRAGSEERRDFVGIWGPNATACAAPSRRKGFFQATITEDGARAGRTECRFRNGRRDGLAWAATADCSDRGRRWTSQVRLVVDGDRLTWTSAKGPAFYVRCGRRDG